MTRVAFLECTDQLWPRVAELMQQECGWETVYWSGGARMEAPVTALFPNVVFHENGRAVRGIPPDPWTSFDLPPLDEGILKAMQHAEADALIMMDRMDPDGSFDFRQRRQLYRSHLQIALAMLDKLQPDIIVNAAPPHLIYDFVIYHACRLRNIQCMVFIETTADGLIYPACSYEDPTRELVKVYGRVCQAGGPAALSERAERYWNKLQADYAAAVPSYVVAIHASQQRGRRTEAPVEQALTRKMTSLARRIAGKPVQVRPTLARSRSREVSVFTRWLRSSPVVRNLGHRYMAFLLDGDTSEIRDYLAVAVATRRLVRMLAQTERSNDPVAARVAMECTLHFFRALETEFDFSANTLGGLPPTFDTYLKQYEMTPQDSELSTIEYFLYRLIATRKKRALTEQYERLVQPVDLDRPYIYVALHYQPEASTSPLAGAYVDQILMIEMLSKLVPDDWLVYVRENPVQLNNTGSGELGRSGDFYRRLGDFPNVRLVSLERSPFDLIDRAKAVATGTGTSGWEALVRGIPVLSFGLPWYRCCEGVFAAASLHDCRKAIAKIAAGYRPDPAKVKLFLQSVEEFGFRGYTIPELGQAAEVSFEANVRSFVNALKQANPAEAAVAG